MITFYVRPFADRTGKRHACLIWAHGFSRETRRYQAYPASVRAKLEACSIIRKAVAKLGLKPNQVRVVECFGDAQTQIDWAK